jgi:glycosyltransferase involved in cell wall biosynthesis
MNVGIIVDNELNNDKRVLKEVEILKENGMSIYVLCMGFGKKQYQEIKGISVSRLRIEKKIKNLMFLFINTIPFYEWYWAFKIRKFVSSKKINILHVHDLYMSKSAAMGIHRSGKKIPMILDLHENYPYAVTTYNWTKGFLRSVISWPDKWQKKEKEYLEYADRIVVLSDDFRDELIARHNFLKPGNFCILPNVPDLNPVNPAAKPETIFPFKKKAPILFYFGVVAERRGIFNALSAFIKVVSKGYLIDFLIIGPVDKKDQKRFNEIISSDAMQERVIFIPWIDLCELPAYLGISDICIAPFLKNPQHESGVANKIYDYMLGRKPVIGSDCRPQQKLIEKYNCGIVFHNENELIEAIIKLLENVELREKMGENGYKAILEDNHLGLVKENLLLMYKKVLDQVS